MTQAGKFSPDTHQVSISDRSYNFDIGWGNLGDHFDYGYTDICVFIPRMSHHHYTCPTLMIIIYCNDGSC